LPLDESSAILAALTVRLFFRNHCPHEYFAPRSLMPALATSQPEIATELLEIQAEQGRLAAAMKRLDERVAELLTRAQSPEKITKKHVPLTFGKNTITWGTGNTLYIKGKGYKLVKALYEANNMCLSEEILGKSIWDMKPEQDELPNHDNFKALIRNTATKLEMKKFPYRLIPEKSEERFEETGKMRGNKPEVRRIQPEITGVRLDAKVNFPTFAPD
jgi:hypothetical protein